MTVQKIQSFMQKPQVSYKNRKFLVKPQVFIQKLVKRVKPQSGLPLIGSTTFELYVEDIG